MRNYVRAKDFSPLQARLEYLRNSILWFVFYNPQIPNLRSVSGAPYMHISAFSIATNTAVVEINGPIAAGVATAMVSG